MIKINQIIIKINQIMISLKIIILLDKFNINQIGKNYPNNKSKENTVKIITIIIKVFFRHMLKDKDKILKVKTI